MKKLLLVFVTVLIAVSGYAQKTADIGIWGGTVNVHGDMDNDTPFQSFNANFGGYFRYNFNARFGVRAMYLVGNFSQEGEVERSPWEYSKLGHDFTVQAEVNYLRYILGKRKMRFSPYVTLGIGFAFFPYEFKPLDIAVFNPDYPELITDGLGNVLDNGYEENEATMTIPFGIGFKYTIGERLGVGAEYQMRKYLSDRLDDLDDPLSYVNGFGETVTYNDGSHNNDWAGYLGVHLTYKIFIGKKACPAYDSKNW